MDSVMMETRILMEKTQSIMADVPKEWHLAIAAATGIIGFLSIFAILSSSRAPAVGSKAVQMVPEKTTVTNEVAELVDETPEPEQEALNEAETLPTEPEKEPQEEVETLPTSTPVKKRMATEEELGTVLTPAGRRSRRLRNKTHV